MFVRTLISILKPDQSQTFGTAAWNTKSAMSASVELEAWMVMTEMFGFWLDLSKVNSIFKPFLLYAVIGGIAAK